MEKNLTAIHAKEASLLHKFFPSNYPLQGTLDGIGSQSPHTKNNIAGNSPT